MGARQVRKENPQTPWGQDAAEKKFNRKVSGLGGFVADSLESRDELVHGGSSVDSGTDKSTPTVRSPILPFPAQVEFCFRQTARGIRGGEVSSMP